MRKRTKALQFDKNTIHEIFDRDEDCIFCKHFGIAPHDNNIFDCAHIVNKSQGGMGVVQNGVKACRYHHHMLDNGNGKELREYAESYLTQCYDNWTKSSVIYSKW